MRKLICKMFGHKPYQGTITWSFYAKPSYSGEWELVTNSGPAVFCSRCDKLLAETPHTNIMMNTEGNATVTDVSLKKEKG